MRIDSRTKIPEHPTGEFIRYWREHRYKDLITRKELAEAAGIGHATLTRYELHGTESADEHKLRALVAAMRSFRR